MNLLMTAYHGTGFGGAERSLLTTAEGLKKRGHDVIIASTAEYGGIETAKFGKYPLPLPYFQRFYLKNFLVREGRKHGIELIHAQDRLTSIGAVLAANELGIPAAVHFRDYWFCCTRSTCLRQEGGGYANCEKCTPENLRRCVPWHRQWWEQHKLAETRKNIPLLDSAQAKIAISGAVKNKMLANGFTGDIKVVPNPVDVEMFGPHAGGKEKQKNKTIAFIGRLSYEKGILQLMEIMERVLAERGDVSFLVAGDGPMRAELENFVQAKKLQGRVHISGRVDFRGLPAIYANSDIVLFPSQWEEPFGRVAIEAGACGTPVVASRAGGIADTIVDGKTGRLVPPHATEEWVTDIGELLDNDSKREKMGEAAMKFVRENFATGIVVRRLEKIYGGVL